MSNSDAHLIQMANDIAANLSPGKSEQEAVEAIAGHIKKFWAPPMRHKIVELWRDDLNGNLKGNLKDSNHPHTARAIALIEQQAQ